MSSTNKIFVGNLPKYAKEEELEVLFKKYGAVNECTIKGKFGFVHMATPEEAEKAISFMNGHNYKSSELRVAPSNNNPPGKSERPRQALHSRKPYSDDRPRRNGNPDRRDTNVDHRDNNRSRFDTSRRDMFPSDHRDNHNNSRGGNRDNNSRSNYSDNYVDNYRGNHEDNSRGNYGGNFRGNREDKPRGNYGDNYGGNSRGNREDNSRGNYGDYPRGNNTEIMQPYTRRNNEQQYMPQSSHPSVGNDDFDRRNIKYNEGNSSYQAHPLSQKVDEKNKSYQRSDVPYEKNSSNRAPLHSFKENNYQEASMPSINKDLNAHRPYGNGHSGTPYSNENKFSYPENNRYDALNDKETPYKQTYRAPMPKNTDLNRREMPSHEMPFNQNDAIKSNVKSYGAIHQPSGAVFNKDKDFAMPSQFNPNIEPSRGMYNAFSENARFPTDGPYSQNYSQARQAPSDNQSYYPKRY